MPPKPGGCTLAGLVTVDGAARIEEDCVWDGIVWDCTGTV